MTPDQLQAIVNEIIKSLDTKDFAGEAINWGDLRCVEVRAYGDGGWDVTVEEADSDAWGLRDCIEYQLEAQGIDAIVHTEW